MDFLTLEIENGIATVTLNRPDKRNALSSAVVRELHTTFSQLKSEQSCRVVVLQGNGKAFCAGADLDYLRELQTFSLLENLDDSTLLQETLHLIYSFPKPTIAKVHGAAIAGGCGLATVCDFVLADTENAIFGYSEVKIGFIPAIVAVYLVRKVGDTQARRLLLSAEMITADEAQRIGVVTESVPHSQLDSRTRELAETLSNHSASSLRLTKELLTNIQGMSLESGLKYATTMNTLTRMTDDCTNGIKNFLSK